MLAVKRIIAREKNSDIILLVLMDFIKLSCLTSKGSVVSALIQNILFKCIDVYWQ